MLQEILGHASLTTTLDLCPGKMDRYVDRLNEAAFRSAQTPLGVGHVDLSREGHHDRRRPGIR